MFEIKTATSIPVEATQREAANKLPFDKVYSAALAATVAGVMATPREVGTFFVPSSFWTERAENKEKAGTKGYQQEKLRNAFRTWQKANPEDANVKAAVLATAFRTGKEEAFKEVGAGMSVWIDLEPARVVAVKAAMSGTTEGGPNGGTTDSGEGTISNEPTPPKGKGK